jgi:hypothetical protein
VPRTVAALYDTRAEAEFARARLVSRVKARSPRIIAKDTAAAVDDLDIAPTAADAYRDGVRGGAHLLVAQVPGGTRPERIIEVLKQAVGRPDLRENRHWGDADHGVRVDVTEDSTDELPAHDEENWHAGAPSGDQEDRHPFVGTDEEFDREPKGEPRDAEPPKAGRSAQVRSFTREAPAEKQVSLKHEVIEIENRPCERQLSETDVESGGLFRERVFEITAMREEPVVTKLAVVREEVIVRKALKARVETIRDTVRHTEVDVEAFPLEEESASTIFGRSSESGHSLD